MCGTGLTADGGTHFFATAHTGKPRALHQPRDRASGHAEAFPLQLAPDFANAIDAVVFVVYALYLLLKQVITSVTLTAFFRMLMVVLVPVVCRRGDIQLMAYRSDPYSPRRLSSSGIIFSRGGRTPPSQISRGLAQDIVAAPQFTDFTLQFFQPLTFGGGESAIAATGIALLPAYPGSERLGGTTNLLGNGTDMAAHCELYSCWLSKTRRVAR
ncbi:Uncharacterised protein [Serratia marcescens]|nr:Uncharacterised protein [Serratia marcescens]CAI1209557.1 Uncharacterised protein [Serratia marcescens]